MYIYSYFFILHGYIMNSEHDQLPVGLTALLAEHCIGIIEIIASNPVTSLTFFSSYFFFCNSVIMKYLSCGVRLYYFFLKVNFCRVLQTGKLQTPIIVLAMKGCCICRLLIWLFAKMYMHLFSFKLKSLKTD